MTRTGRWWLSLRVFERDPPTEAQRIEDLANDLGWLLAELDTDELRDSVDCEPIEQAVDLLRRLLKNKNAMRALTTRRGAPPKLSPRDLALDVAAARALGERNAVAGVARAQCVPFNTAKDAARLHRKEAEWRLAGMLDVAGVTGKTPAHERTRLIRALQSELRLRYLSRISGVERLMKKRRKNRAD